MWKSKEHTNRSPSRSGEIRIDGDFICYSSESYGDWKLPSNEVAVFGEMTNENGPFADDYFFVFVTKSKEWYEASFYAEGVDKFLVEFEKRMGLISQSSLANSTTFRSNVLWPERLTGKDLFEFYTEPVAGFLGRFLIKGSMFRRLSAQVLNEIEDK